jgi:hypothetical protein
MDKQRYIYIQISFYICFFVKYDDVYYVNIWLWVYDIPSFLPSSLFPVLFKQYILFFDQDFFQKIFFDPDQICFDPYP